MGKRLFSLLFLLFCSVVPGPFHLSASAAHADQPRTVRVGLHSLSQFTRISNGNASGYIPDLLAQISRYTGWNVEYVVMFDGTESSYEVALQRADTAQYLAKQAGKNCFRFYDPDTESWDGLGTESALNID